MKILTKETIKEIEKHIEQTTFRQETCIEWLLTTMPPLVTEFAGVDCCGIALSATVIVPQSILKPPPFNEKDWPLNEDESMFSASRKYNYMINTSTLSLYGSRESLVGKAIYGLYTDEQSQSRFRTVWHQIMASVYALDDYLGHTNHPVRAVLAQLNLDKGLPFKETAEGIDLTEAVEKGIDSSTLLPSILYMLISVSCDICFGISTEVEGAFTINHYLNLAQHDYADEKLRIKSACRNWFAQALSKLDVIAYPVYNNQLEIIDLKYVHGKEPKYVSTLHEKVAESRQRKLSKYPYLLEYIDRSRKAKTVEELIHRLLVMNALSNDRSFYKTRTELSLDAAVKSEVREHLVSAPVAKLIDPQSNRIYQKYFIRERNEAMYYAQQYLLSFVPALIQQLSKTNFDEEWLRFLTTSSPGVKLPQETLDSLSKTSAVLSKSRRGLEALEASEYRSINRVERALEMVLKLVQRQQNDRRQRAIAGEPNSILLLTLVYYVILSAMYAMSTDAAQGKQVGNSMDLQDLLFATTQTDTLVSSIDIVGMDASVQSITTELSNIICLEVTRGLPESQIGPFTGGMKRLLQLSDEPGGAWKQVEMYVSGTLEAVVFEGSHALTSTTYESKIFGSVKNYAGTYPSGRADTSSHHTKVLEGATRGNEMRRRTDERIVHHASTIVMSRNMGDDKSDVYTGSFPNVISQLVSDKDVLAQLGFKTDADLSSHNGEFLQQHVCRGRLVGKPSRISIGTVEHRKEKVRMHEACQELLSIMDDLIVRIRDTEGLKMMIFSFAIHCINSIVLNIAKVDLAAIISKLTSNNLRTYVYPTKDEHAFQLVRLYFPLMWFFMHKGGELPAYPIERVDGTYTDDESVYTVRGEYKRRLMFDIIGIDKIEKFGDAIFRNNHCFDIGLNAADAIIKLKITDLPKEMRSETLEHGIISNLAKNLESFGNAMSKEASLQAKLRIENELAGVRSVTQTNEVVVGRGKIAKVPKSIVYAHRTEAQLEQILMTRESDNEERPMISKRMLDHIASLSFHHVVNVKTTDKLHLYYFYPSGDALVYGNHAKYTEHFELAPPMWYLSPSWRLYGLLGTASQTRGDLLRQINWLKGKYGTFKLDDEKIRYGYDVIWRKNRHLLNDYMTMIGASPHLENLLKSIFRLMDRWGTYRYDYIQTPRNIFFISDNPLVAEQNIIFAADGDEITRPLQVIVGYLHILAHINTIFTRPQVKLTEHLIEYMHQRAVHTGRSSEQISASLSRD
uniref:RNA-dependent RNA polymerase n=1 Tax=Anopheles cypovirus TaxID=1769781 RepID=A0A159D801_9REOV|nr:RNA-dependent RNA polymerase [Anopheles cypovirus]